MKSLWADESIQFVLLRGKGYALYDNLGYFMERIEFIFSEDYVACDEDILRARLVDIGIDKQTFIIDGRQYQYLDASGHRSQRHKWQFVLAKERPDCVVFVASLSGYNSCLPGDTTIVRFMIPGRRYVDR